MQTVPVPDGQYLKIVVSFTRSNTSGKDSPILEDLTVANNNPPTADANGPYTVDEGSPVTLDGSGSSDPDGDVVNYEWDLDYDGQFDDATGVTAFVTYDDNGLYTVGLKVTDPFGESDTDDAIVTVNNVAPTVGPITAPAAPVGVGTPINASAGFTDPGTADTHTAVWDWGDGTTPGTVTQGAGSGSVADSHTYSAAGIYTIVLTVTDDDGGVGQSTFQYVVVYDPSAGFVTGGGWIDSPAGAYKPDPNLEGKANFGFVAKYKKGKSTPDGNTEFQFHAGDLNFHSSSYDWLVVTGSDYAMFKGLGTINGMGEYKFRIWAGDDAPDTFRIKIWTEDGAGVETVVYDNGSDQAIAGGQIVIHTKK
jgi:PKD repeat protein